MRNRKKFLAGMLAATMVLNMALSVDVSAEEGSEAQTAKNTVVEMNETAVAENNVYYVSSDGNDENSGMSAEEAFKTLDQINKLELQPGDQVLLERGSVFEDQYIHVKGSGTEEKPIIISSYGDESKPLPLINTNGKGVWYQDYNLASLDSSSHVLRGEVSSCILLYDVEYIEISNIAMTNEGNFAEGEEYNSADRMDRTGVAGITQNIGTADHIVLRNLDIRNIQGNVYNKHMCNGGIYMVCAQPKDLSTGIAKYDDVLIEGCTLDNVNRWGIAVGYTCYLDKFKTAELPDDTVRTYGSTNVVVRNNYLSDLGGDGITMMYCFRPLVERNVVKEFSRDMNNGIYKYPVSDKNGHKNRGGMLAAGIWPWKCKTPLFQYNECYDSYLSPDSQAWDADSGDNCIYQYNYSSNNAGGCVMFCLGQAVNTVFRYNISQNDLGGVLNLSGNPNGEIYNNVFYMKENVPVNRMSGGKSNIYNNIFYYDGKEAAPASVCNWGRIQANWSNNVYYNYSSIPKDENAITEDPQFVNGGKAPAGAQENGNVYDRSVFDGYKLQDSSPAIDAGKPVSDAGGQDFFGNKLDMMPDIGAFETGRYVPEPEEPQEDGVFDESGSRYFRIPALITLADGGLMAAADARFGSAADSPNNLDTTVAFRPAGQSQWEDATIPFHFVDISDKPGVVNKNSASFIDPVIVQAKDGTIFLMADAFPYGTGSGQSKEGSGMIEADGNKYLALTEKGKDVTNMNNFTMGIKEDGTVWDFTNNKATEYTVDKEFNLYKNGQALTVEQRDPNLKYNGKNVPMNIFYEDSELQVYRTSYLWMASSKDGGKTWSSPQILNELKDKDEKFLGFGPGRGHVIQKGKFAGRILIPVYSTVAGRGERASVLYSDDKGITWKKGPVTTLTTSESLNPGKTSEAQFVELPDGSVRMYARGTTGYVGYADSEDGITYGAFKEDPQLAYCGNSMVSVINYSKTIEGKPVLILSSPEHREIRKNGVMRIGLINENTDGSEKYTVDWKYRYEINRDEFIYSCLTELPDGNIGLLYETHVDNGAPMNYAEYRLQDVLQEEDSAIEKIVISPKNPKPGDEITATVTLKKPATNAEKLSDATLDILYPGLERGKDILTFQSISEGNKVLTYKGTLAESESSYDFIVRMPEWCSHPTVGKKSPVVETEDGLVNPANKDTVYGNASVDVQQVDKLKLEALIAYAESQKEKAEYADVVDVVKTLFEKTLTEAKAVMADEKAEQAAVDAAYEALLANVHLLGFTGNTDDLALALELAKTTNTEGKTPESVQVLKDAIAKAEEIIADGNVLQEEIDAAREALLAAIDGLEDVVLADKTKLKGLLEDSQKYVEKIDEYTKATADAFMAAREAAQSVYDNQEATQEQVNAAYDTLLQAIFGLRLIPDKSKLEELLKEAEGIDLAKYTEETVVVFRTVLAKAEAVFGNGNASETEVKEAEKMLRAAMDGLEEKKANPEKPNSAQGESGQQGNTKPNGGADKATKTGDEALSIVWMMLMVAGAVVVFKRKKRSI
mgnify:CR=1 FL=1